MPIDLHILEQLGGRKRGPDALRLLLNLGFVIPGTRLRGCESTIRRGYVTLVGRPEFDINLAYKDSKSKDPAIVSSDPEVCSRRVIVSETSGVSRFSYEDIILNLSIKNIEALSSTSDGFEGKGVVKGPANPGDPGNLRATLNSYEALRLLDDAITSRDDEDILDRLFEEDIFYTLKNRYGNLAVDSEHISCPTKDSVSIQIHGVPSVGFSASTKGIDTSDDTTPETAEACVNEDSFTISSTTTNSASIFYIDGTQEGRERNVVFNPSDVRNRRVVGDRYQYGPRTEHQVVYTGSNEDTGCRNFISKSIDIYSIPDVDLTPSKGCENIETSFAAQISNLSHLTEGIKQHSWSYTDNEGEPQEVETGLVPTFSYQFSPGIRKVTLSVLTNKGCLAETSKLIDVGILPRPEFFWQGSTVEDPVTFLLHEGDLGFARIRSTSFHVERGGSILPNSVVLRENVNDGSYLNDIAYIFTDPGLHDVVFEVSSIVGCRHSLRRSIEILSILSIPAGGSYSVDFESRAQGWLVDTLQSSVRSPNPSVPTEINKKQIITTEKRVSSWSWGTLEENSSYINTMVNGSKAWLTKIREVDESTGMETLRQGYSRLEASWLYTPAFDISLLKRPTVEFHLIYQFDDKDQGAVFQYSIDDGLSWVPVGDLRQLDGGTGLNWYTHEDIDTSPGGQLRGNFGWAASSSQSPGQWLLARHRLEVISEEDRSSVRFRFALSAPDASPKGEGIGIDNFWIGDRDKVVLIEEFSNEFTESAHQLHQTISNYLSGLDEARRPTPYVSEYDAIRITYYATPEEGSVGPVHRLYQINPLEVNARLVHYGLPIAPTTLLEGDFSKNMPNRTERATPSWTLNELNKSALERSLFDVSIQELSSVEGVLNIGVNASLSSEGIAQGLEGDYRLHVVITQREIVLRDANNSSQERTYRDVMRRMLPSAAGTSLIFNSQDESQRSHMVQVSWPLFSVRQGDLEGLQVVAFIQQVSNKRVYQATIRAVEDLSGVIELGIEERGLVGSCLSVYPNPTAGKLSVDSGPCGQFIVSWKVVDDKGRTMMRSDVEFLSPYLQLDLSSLLDGTYTLVLRGIDGRYMSRRIFIRK